MSSDETCPSLKQGGQKTSVKVTEREFFRRFRRRLKGQSNISDPSKPFFPFTLDIKEAASLSVTFQLTPDSEELMIRNLKKEQNLTTPDKCPSSHGGNGFAPGSYVDAITLKVVCGICGGLFALPHAERTIGTFTVTLPE